MSFFNRLFGKKDPQRQPLDQNQFLQAFEQFVNARSWDESRRIVEQQPILLLPDGDDLLRQLAAAQPDPQRRQAVEEHRTLLRRCREAGIPRAFAEKMLPPETLAQAEAEGISPEQALEMAGTAEGMPPELREVLAELAATGIEIRSQEDLDAALAARPELRAKLEAAAQAAGGGLDVPPQFREDIRQAQEAEGRYRRTGDRAALDAAAVAWERILDHPTFPDCDPRLQLAAMNDGGGVFLRRYWARGRLADLDRALSLWQQAVGRTPPDSPDLPSILNNLGTGLRARYARTGQLADLEEAIRVYQQAVGRTPPDSPDLPGYLNNLGTGLRARYARTGQLADLEEAIRVYQQAVGRTPPDSPDLPSILNNLGTGLSDRYARTGQLADLEEAIRVYQQAVGRTPPDSPDLPSILNNLGTGLRARYARTGQLTDLEEARSAYGRACRDGMLIQPEAAVISARSWGNWALERWEWEEASMAYGFGSQAIDQLFRGQLGRAAKESWLREAQGLPANTAYALAKLDRLEEAVEAIEAGRARLLAEALEANRRDLEQLEPLGHGDLLARYRAAADRLAALQTQVVQPAAAPGVKAGSPRDFAALSQEIEAARDELDAAIAAIRAVSGYEDFFLPPSLKKIRQAAAPDAPLVYLLTTAAGGLALILPADGEVAAVNLPDLTDAALRQQLTAYFDAYAVWRRPRPSPAAQTAWFAAIDGTTRWLWDAVMGQVTAWLRRAGFTQVTLIPTGLLALLPLHAAWTDDPAAPTGRRYALDDIAFGYAASAVALAEARRNAAAAAEDRLLAVDEPRPVRGSALPNSAAEVAAIASLFQAPRILRHEGATRAAVLAALPGAQIVHLSCHGATDWGEPLRSGVVMARDEMLTVGDLLDRRLPPSRLAALSACETGIVGAKLPDEVVALPAALAQAGFAGVAASLWSVADVSTAMLMERFYRLWREEGRPPAAALCAAQRWLRDTTNREKADYFRRDIPALSAGKMPEMIAADFFSQATLRQPAGRDFSHPFWWAAFYLTGV